MFNRLVDLIDSANKSKMVLCLGPSNNFDKVSLENMTMTNIVTSSTSNKSFILNTGLSNSQLADIANGYFVVYTLDNEFILGTDSVTTKSEKPSVADGVVAKYSKFYTRFYDGIINTGDYFYSNKLTVPPFSAGDVVNVIFIDGEDGNNGNPGTMSATSSFAGNNYIVIESPVDPGWLTYEQIIVPGSEKNVGSFTIISNETGLAQDLGYPSGYYAYQVNEEVVYEEVFNAGIIYDVLVKHYLKMYLNNNGSLAVQFMDEGYTAIEAVDTIANNTFFIQSAKSNFKQTIEASETVDISATPYSIDFMEGAIKYINSTNTDFEVDFINVPAIPNTTITYTLIINQGATPYMVTGVTVNTNAQTIKWANATEPEGNSDQVDIVGLMFIFNGSGLLTQVLGQMGTFA
jgi:hypothetical protein